MIGTATGLLSLGTAGDARRWNPPVSIQGMLPAEPSACHRAKGHMFTNLADSFWRALQTLKQELRRWFS